MEDTIIEDVLQTVEKFYVEKDYQGALRTLESNQGKISPGIWHYNMGTVLGKLEQLPLARFHLLAAIENGFSDKPVIVNKDLIESKLGVDKIEKPLSAIDYGVKSGINATHGILTALSLILLIVGLVSYFRKSSFKLFTSLIILSASTLLLNWWITTWDKYIVVEAQSIHDGPSGIFASQAELPAGLFIVTRPNGSWLQIIYPSRFQGWIKNTGLMELK